VGGPLEKCSNSVKESRENLKRRSFVNPASVLIFFFFLQEALFKQMKKRLVNKVFYSKKRSKVTKPDQDLSAAEISALIKREMEKLGGPSLSTLHSYLDMTRKERKREVKVESADQILKKYPCLRLSHVVRSVFDDWQRAIVIYSVRTLLLYWYFQ